jgi:tetratricopeptide (TPR) repeat protein
MASKPKSSPAKPSWAARHPLAIIAAVLAVCLGPFLDQAIQTDDTLFVWMAQWIQHHPADFFGFPVNWWGTDIPMWQANYNPPLLPYLLALVGGLFGWHEVVLHLAGLGVAFVAAAGVFALAQRWCQRPLLAAGIAILMPAFLILGTTLMCDVLMLAGWIWAVFFWDRAGDAGASRWNYAAAGALAGLALLAKYSAINLVPLLACLGLLRSRKWNWGWAALALPLLTLAGYDWLTARMYGHGLFSLATHYARAHSFGYPGGWHARGIIGLAFAGGSLLPVLCFTPWLWRPRTWLLGAVVLLGALVPVFWLPHDLGLMHPWADPDGRLLKLWDFRLQVLVLTAAGAHLLLLAGAEAWQRRDRISLALALWIGGVFFFTTVLNWTVNARSFLPAVPAAAILVVRRLKASPPGRWRQLWLAAPLAPAAALALGLAWSNFQMANASRSAAEKITAEFKSPDHTIWINGHSGFQYYMQLSGGRPLDLQRSRLEPGDLIAIPLLGDMVTMPPQAVAPLKELALRTHVWFNLQACNARCAAGFYTSDAGPVPFALGGLPTQEYFIVKVFPRIQFRTEPSNPQAVTAGDVPSFAHLAYSLDDTPPAPVAAEVANQVQLAGNAALAGDFATAAGHFEAALAADTNNVVALSQLAWIHATASQPPLRDPPTALAMAHRAAELSDWRRAEIIRNLAIAYGANGEYEKGIQAASFARNLAIITGESEMAMNNAKLIGYLSALQASAPAPAQ